MVNTTLTKPFVLSASTVTGNKVTNLSGEHLGKIEEIMLDIKKLPSRRAHRAIILQRLDETSAAQEARLRLAELGRFES